MSISITLYNTVSIDGFIAESDDNTPWSDSTWQQYLRCCRDIGHLIMGRRTYELFLLDTSVDSSDFKSLTVVSGSLSDAAPPFFCARSPQEAVERIQKLKATEALLIGGSQTASSFLRHGLLNAVRLEVEPVIFGCGKSMFVEPHNAQRLILRSSSSDATGRTTLMYSVEDSASDAKALITQR